MFLAKVSAFFWILVITVTISIMVLTVYVSYLPTQPRLLLKSYHSSMDIGQSTDNSLYSGYFKHRITKQKASLVIIVLSVTGKHKRREAIRETWWKDCGKHKEVVCRFMVDTPKDETENSTLLQEANSAKDIIISPINKGMLFGHRIIFAMKWSLYHYNFDYLMRVDDDVLLCIEHILHRYREIPRTNFMSGVLHCNGNGAVWLDEGIVTFSRDLVYTFISQDSNKMYCHTYGDQTYSTWINHLKLNPRKIYHIETRIHHHPPASRVPDLRNKTRVCNQYVALHGVYGNDMKMFWNHRGENSFPTSTGLMSLNELCPFDPTYNWMVFASMFRFEPKLCNDPVVWKGVGEAQFGRE